MEKEIKLVKYVLLTYIMYGLMNVFILNDFVVPLPIIYIAIPLVAVYFFWLSIRTSLSWFLLIIPFIVLKDIMMDFNVNLVAIVTIVSLVSWVLFGVVILKQKYVVSIAQKVYGIFLLATVLSLLPTTFNLTWVILPFVGLLSFVFTKNLESKLNLIKSKVTNHQLETNNAILEDKMILEISNNQHQSTLLRINLLIILISGFYVITLFSIWSITW